MRGQEADIGAFEGTEDNLRWEQKVQIHFQILKVLLKEESALYSCNITW